MPPSDRAHPTTIPALSLWQPWASLAAAGRKLFETRHWAWSHRGRFVIHAAQKIVHNIDPTLREIVEDQFGGHWGLDLPRGVLIGTADLVAVHRTEDLLASGRVTVTGEEYAQGNFGPGRYGFELATAVALATPIKWRGHQGPFLVPVEVLQSQGGIL